MRIKARIKKSTMVDVPGTDEIDVFMDSEKDWIALREFTVHDVQAVKLACDHQGAIVKSAPQKTVVDRRMSFEQWAKEWPTKFYAGRHNPAGGSLIMPNGQVVKREN